MRQTAHASELQIAGEVSARIPSTPESDTVIADYNMLNVICISCTINSGIQAYQDHLIPQNMTKT